MAHPLEEFRHGRKVLAEKLATAAPELVIFTYKQGGLHTKVPIVF